MERLVATPDLRRRTPREPVAMIQWDDARRALSLAVHDLIAVGPSLPGVSLALGGTARARAGAEHHRAWQARRGAEDAGFQREVQIRHEVLVQGWTCVVTGRLDGLSQEGGRLVVEELKSSVLDGGQLEALDSAALAGFCQQLQLYLHLLAARGQYASGRLVLSSLMDGRQRLVPVPADPGTGAWLAAQLAWLVAAREDLLAHRQRRRAAPIPFAHGGFRLGQERLVAAVEGALGAGRHLLLSAPTGVGKTAATLLGALRVAWERDLRVFVATSRTTQQRLVLQTLEAMRQRGLVVRALGLRAKGRSCLAPVQDCHPERCPFADDLQAKLRTPELLDDLLAQGVVWPDAVVEAARSVQACPFALATELMERCDVVVGDYSYVFDPQVMLRRAFGEQASDGRGPAGWLVLVDEAHNLPERARAWLSPGLRVETLRAAEAALDDLGSGLGPQHELAVQLLEVVEDAWDLARPAFPDGTRMGALDLERLRRIRDEVEAQSVEYGIALQRRWRQGLSLPRVHLGGEEGDPWLLTGWALGRLVDRLAEAGEETVVLLRPAPGQAATCGEVSLLCRDPAPWLGGRVETVAGAVFLSGTLEPLDLYHQRLGLRPERTDTCRIPSPFDPERLAVLVCTRVSTRLQHRERDRAATADIVERVVAAIPGNCAVLFPSFTMRDEVGALLALPARERLDQRPDMPDIARQALLDRLAGGEGPPRVLLGVTGGIFAEGVDLPGHALVGVVVVGPALPVVGPEQELIRAWLQEREGQGFRAAYVLPGMSRVVQAAGRVIRSPEDRGVVVLVGQRFVQNDYVAFFPEHWQPVRTSKPWRDIERFFAG
ncbi:MAG: ATP-dependent DNA helicase [Pseudomonadota bacterium]